MTEGRALFLVFLMTSAGFAASTYFHAPLYVGFFVGVITLTVVLRTMGMGRESLFRAAWSGVKRTQEVLIIMLLIGALIPAWMLSGTIPILLIGAFQLISPHFFLVSSCLIAGLSSMILGTTLGTLSTVGIPLMGMAHGLGVSEGMVAGALLSGALIGDRTSPFSSAFHLLANATELNPWEQWRALLPTLLSAGTVSFFLFFLIDLWNGGQFSLTGVSWMAALQPLVRHPFFSLLPVLLFVPAILLRLPIKWAFLLTILSSFPISLVNRPLEMEEWFSRLWEGISLIPAIPGGGMKGMINLLIFIALTGVFSGMLEASQLLHKPLEKAFTEADSLIRYTEKTLFFSIFLTLFAGNQALPVLLLGRHLTPVWRRSFSVRQLARVIADSAIPLSALVPWNIFAILSAGILGVKTVQYLPFAFFLWLIPLMTLFYSRLESDRAGKERKVIFR
ncbi:MAG: hypothetical protein IMW85_04635 [Thermicanus sp.]|nr:hypothetical protein [Thermicanus sp.]